MKRILGLTVFIISVCTAVTFAGQKSKKTVFPLTRAEASNFTETSRYEDVINFISELQKESNDFNVEYFGTTFEGKKFIILRLVVGKSHLKFRRHDESALVRQID